MQGGARAEEVRPGAGQAVPAAAAGHASEFKYFSFLDKTPDPVTGKPKFSDGERVALFVTLGIAICGLLYALMLMGQVKAADNGTKKMQEIADAVREGANAYLKRQLTTVAFMIAVLVVVLFVTKAMSSDQKWGDPFAWGRAGAFLIGAIFGS